MQMAFSCFTDFEFKLLNGTVDFSEFAKSIFYIATNATKLCVAGMPGMVNVGSPF